MADEVANGSLSKYVTPGTMGQGTLSYPVMLRPPTPAPAFLPLQPPFRAPGRPSWRRKGSWRGAWDRWRRSWRRSRAMQSCWVTATANCSCR